MSADESKPKKILAILNTPLVLWFLSTIVVGLISFFYSRNEKMEVAEAARNNRVSQIDTEVFSRLRSFDYSIPEENLESDQNDDSELLLFFTLFSAGFSDLGPLSQMLPFEASSGEDGPVQNGAVTTKSLLWELHSLVPDKEKPEVERALLEVEKINILLSSFFREFFKEMYDGDIDDWSFNDTDTILLVRDSLEEILESKRWKMILDGNLEKDRLKNELLADLEQIKAKRRSDWEDEKALATEAKRLFPLSIAEIIDEESHGIPRMTINFTNHFGKDIEKLEGTVVSISNKGFTRRLSVYSSDESIQKQKKVSFSFKPAYRLTRQFRDEILTGGSELFFFPLRIFTSDGEIEYPEDYWETLVQTQYEPQKLLDSYSREPAPIAPSAVPSKPPVKIGL